jgi:pimeloyl-ACP methyl ester carboxylesterase
MTLRIRVPRVDTPGVAVRSGPMLRVALFVGGALLAAACGVSPGVTASEAQRSSATFDPLFDPFGWTRLGGHRGVETGDLVVPMDYADPSKGTFDLFIARHLALKPGERIGSLLVNPGGPGFGGSDFAVFAKANFDQALLDHFDIVAWDPRGTGSSEPKIDCIDDYDHFFGSGDITPDDADERQQLVDVAKEFANDCITKNAAFYQYVGTNNSARDIDAIRTALGEATISYLGFSYGSELGATWATLFPTTVRAAVLDGAVDPTAGLVEGAVQQNKGFEASFDVFLAECSADSKCPFNNGGDAAGAFDRLMLALDQTAVPSRDGRPDVSQGIALSAVGEAMYSQSTWPELATALTEAQGGNGAGLLDLYDRYFVRQADGSYENSLEAFQVISCMDSAERTTVAEDDANVARYQAVAPRLAMRTVGDYFCTFFPPPGDPRVGITGKGAGPIVVLGTTGDPATPLAGAEKMAAALEGGHLVTVVGNQHTGYGVNACSSAAVDDYLVDPVGSIPAIGLRCG